MLISKRTANVGESRARLLGDRWTIVTAPTHSGYPASKLISDNLADYALFYNQDPSGTWIAGTSDVSPDDRIVGAVSVLGLNRARPSTPPAGHTFTENGWRVRFDLYPLHDRVRPAPTGISNLVNLTGSLSDISGPLAPPVDPQPVGYVSTRLESANPALGTSFRVTFDNHYATERPLDTIANGQVLRVHAALSSGGTFAVTPNLVTVTAVPSSGPSFALSFEGRERTTEGYIYHFWWSASSLTVPSATLSFDIAAPSYSGAALEYCGVEWEARITGVEYDQSLYSSLDSGESGRVLPAYEIPSGETRYMLIDFSSFGAVETFSPFEWEVNPMNGPLRVGRAVVCETFELPTTNDGWVYSPQSNGEAVQMRDGSERFPTTVLSWDEYEIKSQGRTEGLAVDDLLLGLYRAVDVRFPFLVIPHEDDPSHDRWVRFVPNTFELSGGGVKSGGSDPMGRKWNLEARVKEHTARAGVRG